MIRDPASSIRRAHTRGRKGEKNGKKKNVIRVWGITCGENVLMMITWSLADAERNEREVGMSVDAKVKGKRKKKKIVDSGKE